MNYFYSPWCLHQAVLWYTPAIICSAVETCEEKCKFSAAAFNSPRTSHCRVKSVSLNKGKRCSLKYSFLSPLGPLLQQVGGCVDGGGSRFAVRFEGSRERVCFWALQNGAEYLLQPSVIPGGCILAEPMVSFSSVGCSGDAGALGKGGNACFGRFSVATDPT